MPPRICSHDLRRRLFPTEGVALKILKVSEQHDTLMPEEHSYLGRMSTKRQREFSTGRLCARLALKELGIVDTPIVMAKDRSPIWPSGAVGSISHTDRIAVAALARSKDYISIGIDVEEDILLEEELWSSILLPQEEHWIRQQRPCSWGQLARLLFSAKEAFYKYQYPLTQRKLDFGEVEITLQLDCDRFMARLFPAKISSKLNGHFVRIAGSVFTAIIS